MREFDQLVKLLFVFSLHVQNCKPRHEHIVISYRPKLGFAIIFIHARKKCENTRQNLFLSRPT